MRALTEKRLHLTFEIGILLKALHGALEVLTGLFFLFINKTVLLVIVGLLTVGELSEDPNDLLSRYLITSADNLSLGESHFIAAYLLGHGVIKLAVIAGLWQKKLWAYPASIVVFAGFIIYQLNRYMHTHSAWLLLFTAFDLIVIALTVHEYTRRRAKDEGVTDY